MTTLYALRRRDWEKRRIMSGPQSVPATRVRNHILWLKGQGLSDANIADLAGVHRNTVYRIKTGNAVWVCRSNAERILAVLGADPSPEWRVPIAGFRRRVEALQWAGWTLAEIGRQLGVNGHVWDRLRYQRIKAEELDRFIPILERMSYQSPPLTTPGQRRAAGKARHTAEKRGYVGWFAWDDIDDPNERPKRKRGHDIGQLTPGDIVRRKLAEGATKEQAAVAAGVSARTVYRIIKEGNAA